MRTPSTAIICPAAGARPDNATGRLWWMRLEGIPVLRETLR